MTGPDRGELKINVESALRTVPVENATVDISYTGEPDQILEEVRTVKMAIRVRWN